MSCPHVIPDQIGVQSTQVGVLATWFALFRFANMLYSALRLFRHRFCPVANDVSAGIAKAPVGNAATQF
ncbi:MAG: hypothetical protein CME90_20110 [Hoeflea sp.]|nr:hypothetical protein [Hoeflea sp.]